MDYSILITNAIAIVSIVLAISTAIVGLKQYRLQGKQKRATFFIELRRKLKDNPMFKKICTLIEEDSIDLRDVAFAEKRDFLGFFEEVSLMMNFLVSLRRKLLIICLVTTQLIVGTARIFGWVSIAIVLIGVYFETSFSR